MALGPPFVVYIDKRPHGSFGETMNEIRAWLDHRKIEPPLFKAADRGRGFEIAFHSEDQARQFERDFAALIQRADLGV